MNKSTIITTFLAGLMMVVMTELLVDRLVGNSDHLQADVLQNQRQTEEPLSSGNPLLPVTFPTSANLNSDSLSAVSSSTSALGIVPGSQNIPSSPQTVSGQGQNGNLYSFSLISSSPDDKTSLTDNAPKLKTSAPETSKITFPILQQAGFEGAVLQRIPFDGWLLKVLDIRQDFTLPVIVQNLLKNNAAPVATFYEFPTKSRTLADHLYGLLKTKFSLLKGASVNSTDEFVEHSFYVNFSKDAKSAFLVVKKGENVYALTYQKESHPFIQMLLPLLP